jgi:antitoxin component YwqK of YwqJK toxin-antitoxin module
MEMDTLELRALSLNRCLFILLIFFSGCDAKRYPSAFFNADTTEITTSRGITHVGGGPVTGVIFSLNTKGDTIYTISYREGKKHGVSRYYHENGRIKSVRYFENGWKEGEHAGWFANGEQEFLYHYKDDMFEGNQKEWMQTGQLYSDLNFEKGQESGSQRVWYTNGKIRTNYIIKNDRRYGLLGTKNCVNAVDSVFNMR